VEVALLVRLMVTGVYEIRGGSVASWAGACEGGQGVSWAGKGWASDPGLRDGVFAYQGAE